MLYILIKANLRQVKIEKTQANDVLISEMDIPKPASEITIMVVLFSIVVFFVLLAIFNLLFLSYLPIFNRDQRLITLVSSVIWLVFIFFAVRSSYRYHGGMQQFMINLACVFAPHQFAEIVRQDTGRKVLCFGYQLFRKRFYYLKIQCDGIKTVDWGAGQGSRGMNDWHIYVWFDKDSATTLNWASSEKPRFGIYAGPSLMKDKTEKLGALFIEFLRNAGVTAAQYDDTTLQGLVGTFGITSCELPPIGKVRLGEHEYYAHSVKGIIDKDTKVRVVEKRGLTLYVERIEAESGGRSG
jgi:hypothetical protein